MSRPSRQKNHDLFPCPVCDSLVISEPGEYEICPVCGWEDDPFQANEPGERGANDVSLNTARRRWRKKLKEEAPKKPTGGKTSDGH